MTYFTQPNVARNLMFPLSIFPELFEFFLQTAVSKNTLKGRKAYDAFFFISAYDHKYDIAEVNSR